MLGSVLPLVYRRNVLAPIWRHTTTGEIVGSAGVDDPFHYVRHGLWIYDCDGQAITQALHLSSGGGWEETYTWHSAA